ncbi:PREDICTED: uncharacterized protein LOC104825577 [Tarenaya hassleriana]|uniref:uncharacterized protein LOC104825577 n=1 Tax=Tarenaya hassleriana TaxID=28532 RepID=UPI00053C16DD|nr:PREDICTED: uncharacterized protein LOC104825577 [Tarenaya hassleriana]
MPTHINCTAGLLVGEISFGMSKVDVSRFNDTSSVGLPRLSCSDRFRDRVVTGCLGIDIWIWIIEYFSKFKKELWTLHDVFEMAPKLPNYLGDYTNEMVAFRCLVYLFDSSPRQNNGVASGVGFKVEFNLSESCEHVLQCILDEVPLSDLKPGAPELLKWNLLPFIENKRQRLPKCTFELLREASRKKSTEVFPSNGEETMGININKNNQVVLAGQRINERMSEKGTSSGQRLGTGDGILGDESEISFSKIDLCDVIIPDTFEENEDGNQDTSIVDEIFRGKAKESNLDPADATVDNTDELNTEAKECFDHSNNQEGKLDVSRSTANDHSEFMASGETQGTSDAENRNGRVEASHDNILPPEMVNGIPFTADVERALGEYPSNEAEESEDQEEEKDLTQMNKANERYENIDDHSWIPSPCRYTCKQCNEGGKLLFCSNEGCPVMIHEKCLASLPAHDDDGNFYCPLCAYALVYLEYLKSKAQVAEAKTKLVSFLNLVNSKLKENRRSGNQVP